MLRNRCGWAWRLFASFLFLSCFYIPVASGAPIVGLPPIRPTIPSQIQPQSLFSLSGYVYEDSSGSGTMSGQGLPAVEMMMIPSGGTAQIALTNGAGYYYFPNLTAGTSYTLEEVLPANFNSTTQSVGYFQLSTGGTLAAPSGASNGTLSPPNEVLGIKFAPSTSGIYSAVNYDFGESPLEFPVYGIPTKPVIPGGSGATGPSASFSTTLSVAGTNDRFLAGAVGAGTLNLNGSVLNTGSSGSLNWQVTNLSTGLTIVPSSTTNLTPGSQSTLTGTVNGTNLSPGTQYASMTVSGRIGATGKVGTSVSNVLIDPVASRGIDSVSSASLGRIIAGGSVSSNITILSAGAYTNYSNLTLNSGSASTSDASGNSFSVSNSAAVIYNGTTTSNNGATGFTATFSSTASGPVSGTAAVPGNTGLFTGETLASGTPTLPTLNVPYTATVLQQRQLTAGPAADLPIPAGYGGLLSGATVPAGFSVISTTDSSHTTNVYVSGSVQANYTQDGSTVYQPPIQVGQVTATQTLINSAGTTAVPGSVLVQGLGLSYSGIASVNVTTAEAASVGDTHAYNPVNLVYNVANVGYAATGGSNASGAQTFGAPLSAPVAQGSTLATFDPALAAGGTYTGVTLTSQVYAIGTAGSNSTALNSPNTNTIIASGVVTGGSAGNVYGTVGSQADILDSTALATSSTVTMAWRSRNSNENGITGSHQPIFPLGIWNLSSDVVDVEGVPATTTYAMEMSFEDGINTLLDGGRVSTVYGTYLAKWNGSAWVNAAGTVTTSGSLAQTAVNDTLSDFLAQQAANYPTLSHDQLLADLAGSWGVAFNTDPSHPGVGISWAIVNNGDGQFAVVPEPSTFVLLGAGAAGMLVYFRRKRAARGGSPKAIGKTVGVGDPLPAITI
jgi:hypothetical protein